MKDLDMLFENCYEKVAALGIQPGNIVSVGRDRAKTRWGVCRKDVDIRGEYVYKIKISPRLLEDDVPDKSAEETMIHEILHSCKNCMNHGREWKALANKVNTTYGYNIGRVASHSDMGIEPEPMNYKYIIRCRKCHAEGGFMRAGSVVKNPGRYKCKCGGDLDVICLR